MIRYNVELQYTIRTNEKTCDATGKGMICDAI